MANQQLVDYIKSQLAAGVTKADLQKAITTAGWSAQDSTDAFNVVEGKTPAAPIAPAIPVAPKPAAPAQPLQPTAQPLQPIASVVQQPMQPIINPTGPTSAITPNLGGPMRASTMQMNVSREGPKSRTVLYAGIIVAAFVVAIAVAAWIFSPQIQQIVGFYLGGRPAAQPVQDQTQVPPAQQPMAAATATTTLPMATSTLPVATSTTSGMVASSTASTRLKH